MSVPGLRISENQLGMTVVRLHYSADPAKAPGTPEGASWYTQARRRYPEENKWNQEFEINWWVAAGTRVYPEFREAWHVKDIDGFRERRPIYRAWDFGWHAPACLIAQLDTKDRLIVLKEVIGKEQTTKGFAETVTEKCAAWFPDHVAGFTDFCDPTGQKANPSASERSEVRDVEILQTLGIYPKWEWGWSRKDGRGLVHQLLVIRTDGTPGLYVNPAGCPVLLQGFLGKYVYPAKKSGVAADEPDEQNHPWSDIHACLRYLCTGLYGALGLRRTRTLQKTTMAPKTMGYGTPIRRSSRG